VGKCGECERERWARGGMKTELLPRNVPFLVRRGNLNELNRERRCKQGRESRIRWTLRQKRACGLSNWKLATGAGVGIENMLGFGQAQGEFTPTKSSHLSLLFPHNSRRIT